MDKKEILDKLPSIMTVLFVAMFLGSVVLLIFYDGSSWFPSFAGLLFVLTSIFTVVCLVCGFLKTQGGEKNEGTPTEQSPIEHKYRLRNIVNVASLSVVIIYILAHIVSSLVSFDTSDVDVTNFYTAFIALCTTFVVGFQIYNSIDLNKKIDKLDADKKELEEQLKNINRITKRCEYFNAYTVGAIRYNDSGAKALSDEGDPKKYCWNAMKAYFNALRLAAEGGQDFRRALEALDGKIRNCMTVLSDNAANEPLPDTYRYIYDDTDVKTFVTTISRYIKNTLDAIPNTEHIDSKTETKYDNLVRAWNDFVLEVEKVVKF